MAIVKTKIIQKVNLNGVPVTRSATITCDEADVAGIADLLEGEVSKTVTEVIGGDASSNVTSYNTISGVMARAEDTEAVYGYMNSNFGSLIVKSANDTAAIQTAFENVKMFPDFPDKKPEAGSVQVKNFHAVSGDSE